MNNNNNENLRENNTDISEHSFDKKHQTKENVVRAQRNELNLSEKYSEEKQLQRANKALQEQAARKNKVENSNAESKTAISSDFLLAGLDQDEELENEKKLGHRIYRLVGYTTVDKVNRKFKQQKHQRVLRNILTTIVIILVIMILFMLYNPFKDRNEIKKITGMDSLFGETETEESLSDEGLPVVDPIPEESTIPSESK